MTDWIEWKGGECPVAEDVLVQYRLREDDERYHDEKYPCNAGYLDWSHDGEREWEIVAYRLYTKPSELPEGNRDAESALTRQPGGTHYRDSAIQPVQFIEANKLGFLEGCIVKRVARHDKPTGKGREDIEKIIHEAQLLLELRYGAVA